MKLLNLARSWIQSKIRYIEWGLMIAIVLAAFWGGTEIQYLVERNRENAQLKAATAAKDKAEAALALAAEDLQKTRADLEAKKRDLEERTRDDVAANPHYSDCRLSPGTVRLLNE